MNLQEFIDYRKICPLCEYPLKLSFHSRKQQTVKYEDNRMLFLFQLNGLKKNQIDYKVGYSFGLKDNSFYVEFYTRDEKRFENDSPEFLRIRFKELNTNLGKYCFYKHCANCECYNYSSNYFLIPLNIVHIEDIAISTEYIGMAQPFKEGFKVYKLLTDHINFKSTLLFGRHKSDLIVKSDYGMVNFLNTSYSLDMIQTAPIKFSSKEETMNRISKLLIFS